ncbi:MAG TPA: hypothetical protein VGD30_08890 [Telluria sp.]
MKFHPKLVHASVLAAMVGLMSLQAGCDKDLGAQIASSIRPANAQDVTASVNQKILEAKFKEAQDEGIAFLKGHEDKSGQLAWALAKASAKLGNHDLAIQYAGEAVKGGAVTSVQLMSEPMLDPVRTDIRFTSLAAGIDTASPAAAAVPAASASGDVSVTAGVEASAGDVSVKLPD